MGYFFERKERLSVNKALGNETNELNKANLISDAILSNVHAYVLLIDKNFKVLKTNYYQLTNTIKDLSDKKVGDLLQCSNALSSIGGCGTHGLCSKCPVRNNIQKALDSHINFQNLSATLHVVTSDHTIVECDALISGSILMLDDVENMVLTVHDVTALKKANRELIAAKIKAENSDRSKSAFLANMSHEIRTPLNAITGFADVLTYTENSEEKKEYADIIKSNSNMLLQLVNDILDISKIEAGTLEFNYADIDINILINDLYRLFSMKLNDSHIEGTNGDVKLITILPNDKYIINTDRNRLSQVFSNFLTNAIKFTKEGEIKIGYEIRNDDIYFFVSDTGSGIPEEKVNKIFDRFYRIDKSKEGNGLGLSICKTIVNKFGGKIGAKSVVGQGSTFWFTIPRKF